MEKRVIVKFFLSFLLGCSLTLSAGEPKQELMSALGFMSGMGHSVSIGAEKEMVDGYVFVDTESNESRSFLINLKNQPNKKFIIFFVPILNNLNSTFDALYIMDAFNKKVGLDDTFSRLIVDASNITNVEFQELNNRIVNKDEILIKLYAMLAHNKKVVDENNISIPSLIVPTAQ